MARPPARRQRWSILWRVGACLLVVVVLVIGASEVRDAFAALDEKLTLTGVPNFGRVNTHLYRGAQPEIAGYAALKGLGIDTVVRLSTGEEYIAAEREHVEALGMEFVSLPWRASDVPTNEQIQAFLDLVRQQPPRTIFVHCRKGIDRTGVMLAIYRIAIDHFTADRHIADMKAFHYRYLFHPHLQTYIEAFSGHAYLP